MKPAICYLCAVSVQQSPRGDWVSFKNHNRHSIGDIGHPNGVEWFCEIHLNEARSLTALTSSDALKELQRRHPAE